MAQPTLLVVIGAKVDAFRKAMRDVERDLDRTGDRLQNAGSRLTLGLTTPLVAAGAASLKFSSNFERDMTRVVTLSQVSEENMRKFRHEILELGPAVGRGPGELAKGMLAVTSTGIRGAEAMDILTMAAKGAATGLGETETVARTITSAVNAYGKENLTAAHAADVLFQTVVEGNAEASTLAPVLGRVMSIAAQMGVSFEEVGASIATFTRLGVGADVAVTSLRDMLSQLLNPSNKAREAMEELGLSADGLRQSIRERGLADTLIMLMDVTEGNVDKIGEMIGDIRGLSGVLGTAGSQAEAYRQILHNLQESHGVMNAAFKRTEETTAMTWDKLLSKLEKVAIKYGDRLATSINKVVDAMIPLLDKVAYGADLFAQLPDPLQQTAIGMLAISAAIGPLAFGLGTMLKTLSAIAALGGIGGALGVGGAATGGAAIGTGAAAATGGGLLAALSGFLPFIGFGAGNSAMTRDTPELRAILERSRSGFSWGMAPGSPVLPGAPGLGAPNIPSGGFVPGGSHTWRTFGSGESRRSKGAARELPWMAPWDMTSFQWAASADAIRRDREFGSTGLSTLPYSQRVVELFGRPTGPGFIGPVGQSGLQRGGGFFGGMGGTLANALPETILRAFTGGGNIGRSIGGLLGGDLAKRAISGGIGKMAGGMLGSVLPGVGTILGGLAGAGLDKLLGGLFRNKEKEINPIREEFVQGHGGIGALNEKAAKAGANLTALLGAKDKGQLERAVANLEAALEKHNTKLAEAKTLVDGLGPSFNDLTMSIGGSKQELADLGTIALGNIAAAMEAGYSQAEALAMNREGLSRLREAYEELGLPIEDSYLKQLMLQETILESNPQLMTAIGGLTSGMDAMSRLGLMTVDTFGAMERQGLQLYSRLQAEAAAAGGTTRDALAPMQDFLHAAEQRAKDLGIPLDDNLQVLIDQSKELGIWKDRGKDATDRISEGIERLVEKMDRFVESIGRASRGLADLTTPPAVGGDGIPQMADGGVVRRPTLALIGEAGPEAVVPLSRLGHMTSPGGGRAVINVNGQFLAEVLVPHLPDAVATYDVGGW